MLACILAVASGTVFASINSKEVGAVLIFPTYQAYDSPNIDTYIQITNDKAVAVNAHIEVIGDELCDDCNFDLPLTGYQTKRLWFNREVVGGIASTVIYDASGHSETGDVPIVHACDEPEGFVVVILEDPNTNPRCTSGENMLHGDEVIVDLNDGTSTQMGAIAVQGVGPNNGDRKLDFNGSEYEYFPYILTGNFWAPNEDPAGVPPAVEPELILFNVDFSTSYREEADEGPYTNCALNYVNAEEDMSSRNFAFDCYARVDLRQIASGFLEDILGTANGFLWARCEEGTHGAMITDLEDTTSNYPYPNDSQHGDTLFQSETTADAARLKITPDVAGGECVK
jgi:hypothetical protein